MHAPEIDQHCLNMVSSAFVPLFTDAEHPAHQLQRRAWQACISIYPSWSKRLQWQLWLRGAVQSSNRTKRHRALDDGHCRKPCGVLLYHERRLLTYPAHRTIYVPLSHGVHATHTVYRAPCTLSCRAMYTLGQRAVGLLTASMEYSLIRLDPPRPVGQT